MSQENVELARLGYRHFNETGAFDAEFISPDCVFDYSNAMPDVPPFRGLDRANAVLREWTAAFEAFQIEVDRVIEAGGGRLVVYVRNVGRPMGSDTPIQNHFVHVFTIRKGRAVRFEGYVDERKALEAVGLSEQDAHAGS